jgi:eukaryotic-like serine/threonine-protein kinase
VVNLPPNVGRYEVVGHLAAGGMAEILLARLTGPSGFERLVVVKRILPQFASTEAFVSMFLDEARIVARIHHPNVVQVQELGREDGDLFLVMEYLEGETAAGLLKRSTLRDRRIDPALAAYIVAEACSGLHAAHELCDVDGTPRPVVHRDISPQNIFVTYTGAVKVLDFGIATTADRITRTEAGQLKGKFEYMSPEQCRGEVLDRRSDLFAVGTVLYELTTGRRLFKRPSQLATLRAISEESVVPPSRVDADYPKALESVVLRALARRREDRYATAAEMRKDLVAAIRALRPSDDDAQEALAGAMRSLFEDRIRDKREMILRVRGGSPVTTIPAGEVDDGVDVPIVPTNLEGTNAASLLEARSKTTTPRARAFIAATLTAVAVVAGLVLARARGGDPAAAAPRDPPSPALTTPVGVVATLPSASSTVSLHLESQPAGARVFVAGEDRGVTPLDLTVPRGEGAMRVEWRSRGFEPRVEVLKPNVDRDVFVTLAPSLAQAPARPPSRTRPTTTPTTPPSPPPPPPSPAPTSTAAADPFQKFN